MFITNKNLSRRTVLKGMGVTMALPLLDAMVPAASAFAGTSAGRLPRAGFIYVPMGADLATWTPVAGGANFELSPTLRNAASIACWCVATSSSSISRCRPRSGRTSTS